jgi:hypothetical protein
MVIQSDASSSDPISPNDSFPPLDCWLCPSSLALSIIAHLEPYIPSHSSKTAQAYLLLLAPLEELFSRTLFPRLDFQHGYPCGSIRIISLIVQSMVDLFISMSELREQIILNPIAESFQIAWFQGLQVFTADNGTSQLTAVSD